MFHRSLLLSVLLLSGCSDDEECVTAGTSIQKTDRSIPDRKEPVNQVTIAAGGCEGNCPMYAFQCDSSLQLSFFGGQHSEKKGFYKGSITRELWMEILQKARQLQFTRWNKTYYETTRDLPTKELVISSGKTNQSVAGSSKRLPAEMQAFHKWLHDEFKQVHMQKSPVELAFTSRLQYTNEQRHQYSDPEK